MIKHKELKHNVKYVLLDSVDNAVGVFQHIEEPEPPFRNGVKRAIFITEDGYKYIVPFLDLINVLEISSLEAELL